MLEFEKVCSRMGITLEPIDLNSSSNLDESCLAHTEYTLRCRHYDTLRISGFYDIVFIIASVALSGLILFIPALRTKIDPVTSAVLLLILIVSLIGSTVHFLRTRNSLSKIELSSCKAFRTTLSPAHIEDIANGVLQFRVLGTSRDVYMHTGEFLVLARDNSIPYLISYASRKNWGSYDFRSKKLLIEVLNDEK